MFSLWKSNYGFSVDEFYNNETNLHELVNVYKAV